MKFVNLKFSFCTLNFVELISEEFCNSQIGCVLSFLLILSSSLQSWQAQPLHKLESPTTDLDYLIPGIAEIYLFVQYQSYQPTNLPTANLQFIRQKKLAALHTIHWHSAKLESPTIQFSILFLLERVVKTEQTSSLSVRLNLSQGIMSSPSRI